MKPIVPHTLHSNLIPFVGASTIRRAAIVLHKDVFVLEPRPPAVVRLRFCRWSCCSKNDFAVTSIHERSSEHNLWDCKGVVLEFEVIIESRRALIEMKGSSRRTDTLCTTFAIEYLQKEERKKTSRAPVVGHDSCVRLCAAFL